MANMTMEASDSKIRLTGKVIPARSMTLEDFIRWWDAWNAEIDPEYLVHSIHHAWSQWDGQTRIDRISDYHRALERYQEGGLTRDQWELLQGRINALLTWFDEGCADP